MPDLNFVLPHWLYWIGLIAFPLMAMALVKRSEAIGGQHRTNLGVGYLCLITGGFVGIHRFYAKSVLGIVYIALFIGIIFSNTTGRDVRVELSQIKNDLLSYEFEVEHFTKRVNDGYDDQAKLDNATTALAEAKAGIGAVEEAFVFWIDLSGWLALAIAIGLAVDAVLLPRMIAKVRAGEPEHPPEGGEQDRQNAIDLSGKPAYYRTIAKLSIWSGEFVAYWSVIAVFVYYYEVIARYIFNSPTNWAHEGMFLMFGMQYLICGAYAYLTDSHVRVDVFYAKMSRRGKAWADIATSVFFFIFAGTLLVTGWTFSLDAMKNFEGPISLWEVSFTEWAIQYWPVKITIALGALFIVIQGLIKLAGDLAIAFAPDTREA